MAKKSILLAMLFVLPTLSLAESELHEGTVNIKSFTDDGSEKVTGQSYNSYGFDGSGTDISFHFFVEPKLAFGFSKTSFDSTYGANASNLSCDIDQTWLSVSYHPQRTNYFTGEGHGLNIGIRSMDEDADCTSNAGDAMATDDGNFLTLEATRGLGNGLVLTLGFESDTKDLLDDKNISFGLHKMLDGNLALSLGISLFQEAEDEDGDYAEHSRLLLGGAYLF